MKKQYYFSAFFSLLFSYTISYAQFSAPQNSILTTSPVILHEHCNYLGRKTNVNIGVYPKMPGNFNDLLSSIKIRSGYIVTLFEHENFNGKREHCIGYNQSCFGDRNQYPFRDNDMASSMLVFPENEIVFFGGSSYQTSFNRVKPGIYNTMPFTLSPLTVASVMGTTSGYMIALYRNTNLQGDVYEFSSNSNCTLTHFSTDAKLIDFLSKGAVLSMKIYRPSNWEK